MRPLAFVVVAVTFTAVAAAQTRSNPPLPPVQPIGAWTPVPELPGMGRPVDTAAVALRRRTVAARIGRGVVLVPAAHERDIERDYVQDNDFRQTNTFFYLTELETQDAWLLIVAGSDAAGTIRDRKSTRLNSSHTVISYAVFCLKKKKIDKAHTKVGEEYDEEGEIEWPAGSHRGHKSHEY